MASGVRVLRGPQWDGDDMDGGEGHLGTLIEVLSDDNSVRVLWDNGNESTCKAGKDGKFELRIFDTAQAGTLTLTVTFLQVLCCFCACVVIRGSFKWVIHFWNINIFKLKVSMGAEENLLSYLSVGEKDYAVLLPIIQLRSTPVNINRFHFLLSLIRLISNVLIFSINLLINIAGFFSSVL